MSGGKADFRVDVTGDKAAQAALQLLVFRMTDMDPVFDEIGASNVTETQQRFQEEKDPEGKAWQITERKASEGGNILRDGADLYDSVTHRVVFHGVEIGANRPYARIHQLGGEAGRGHATEIVARPYLGVSAEGRVEIRRIVEEYLTP
jgi:phage virion morphogenesis protein